MTRFYVRNDDREDARKCEDSRILDYQSRLRAWPRWILRGLFNQSNTISGSLVVCAGAWPCAIS